MDSLSSSGVIALLLLMSIKGFSPYIGGQKENQLSEIGLALYISRCRCTDLIVCVIVGVVGHDI